MFGKIDLTECNWTTITTAATTVATIIGAALLYRRVKNYFQKADVPDTFSGGGLVARVLNSHDVPFIFTLIGGHISPIVVAAEKLGIRVVDTRNEATAVFAADAAARLTGEIGVAIVTAGPGVTNCLTAAKNAQLAESPVLIIGGAAATILKGRGALQDVNQLQLFEGVCKFTGSATTIREIAPLLCKAIQIALSDVPGPVFVELPVDILYQYPIVSSQFINKSTTKKTFASVMRDWYIQLYLNNIYSGWNMPQKFTPLPVSFPMPKKAHVMQCAKLLRKAKRPFIVIGSQAMLPPITASFLQIVLNGLKIPVSLGGMARGLLGKDSAIQFRFARKYALQNADLIILAGTVCDFRLSYGRSLSSKANIISVNRDEKKASLNAGIFWNPALIVKGDVATFLVELSQLILGYSYDIQWYTRLLEAEQKRNMEIADKTVNDSTVSLDPVEFLMELDKQMPSDSIIIGDGGDFVATASYILQPSAPLSWLDPGPFGTLGVGGGFALGAKLVRPEAIIWVIFGDGACGYSIMEYDTFVRHQLPVISIVGNDACWSQIERDQKPLLGASTACMLTHSDYHVVAQGLGAEGLIITKTNDKWRSTLQTAIQKHRNGAPVLINVWIARSDFRQGSIAL